MELAMGLYDAPQIQQQPVLYLDPLKANIAVFGGPMTGKTTFIETYLVRINEKKEFSDRENTYIIDFGGNLGDYSLLGSVCACFDNSNEENIKRIFKTLDRRLAENAEALGSSSYYSLYCKKPEACPTHLTLIIENLNAFLSDERYAAYQDRLMRLCRDGLSKGLTVIVTANDVSGTGRLMANFGQKIAFEMAADSYFDIFSSKISPPMRLPGRGLVNINSEIYEFQCFFPYVSDEESELQDLIRESRKESDPEHMLAFDGDLTRENISIFCPDIQDYQMDGNVIAGLDYYEHKPVYVKIGESRSIAIYGKRQFGKTNLLTLLLEQILSQNETARVVLLDDGRHQLEKFRELGRDTIFLNSVETFHDYLTEHGYGGRRSVRTVKSAVPPKPVSSDISPDTPFTVFVLQSKALYQSSVDAVYLMGDWLPEMIGSAEDRGYLFIFSDVRNISSPEVRMPFNNAISMAFLLDNIGEFINDKGSRSVFGEMDPKELKAEYAKCSVGDGYAYDVEADSLTKLKFIKAEEPKQNG
ncbi:MAG: cell division protein FtsK [Eubacterium sp.]|nr:cell division protein FtsK [Eubacterium sp.]